MESLGPTRWRPTPPSSGFTSKVQPYLSSALGSSEATLQEVVSAFAVFPNQGVRVTPFEIVRVADRQGNVLEENRPTSTEALRADTAFVMTHLLRGVVDRGTAARAASLKWPIGGKTGTTDDFTDAWFVGFDPDITIGVWVGYDRKKIARQRRERRHRGAADLDGRHEGLDRRSEDAAGVRGAGQRRLPADRSPQRRAGRPERRRRAARKPSSSGTQPGAGFGSP